MTTKFEQIRDRLQQIKGNVKLVSVGDLMGYPRITEIKEIVKVEIQKYAQYNESLLIQFKLPKKHKLRGLRFLPNQEFAVFGGDTQINGNVFKTVEERNGMVITTYGPAHDPEHFEQVLATATSKPIVLYRKGWENNREDRFEIN